MMGQCPSLGEGYMSLGVHKKKKKKKIIILVNIDLTTHFGGEGRGEHYNGYNTIHLEVTRLGMLGPRIACWGGK